MDEPDASTHDVFGREAAGPVENAEATIKAKRAAVDRWVTSIFKRLTDPQLHYEEINRLFFAFVEVYPGVIFPPLIEKKALDLALAVYPLRQDLRGRLAEVERMLEEQWPLLAYQNRAAVADNAMAALDGLEARILAIGDEKSRFEHAVAAFLQYLAGGRPEHFPAALEVQAFRYLERTSSRKDAAAHRRDIQPWWNAISCDPVALRQFYSEFEPEFWPLYDRVQGFTLTSIERLYDLYKAVEYVSRAGIPGAIVECGVWRGGSMMLAALTLKRFEDFRQLFLFDTFSGMPRTEDSRDIDLHGDHAMAQWHNGWARALKSDVHQSMRSTGYPEEYIYLIEGFVENTLLHDLPNLVSLVRLDTDFYNSTKVELEALWPLLQPGGIMIIDDYGHWLGARKATDEFFAAKPVRMVRVDYSCRVIQK